MASRIEGMHEPFYLQHITVSAKYEDQPRVEVFRRYCEGKKVLHIGCTQYPLVNVERSLHIQLAPYCSSLDGYDVEQSGYEVLRPHIRDGAFLRSLLDARGPYDVILIPEVMEHVADVGAFLGGIVTIQTRRVIITVPDLFQCYTRHFDYDRNSERFVEAVHPDHNCWYSPYTLANTLRKYSPWTLEGIYWINKISLMAVCCVAERRAQSDLVTTERD